jgi:hypothetical protein
VEAAESLIRMWALGMDELRFGHGGPADLLSQSRPGRLVEGGQRHGPARPGRFIEGPYDPNVGESLLARRLRAPAFLHAAREINQLRSKLVALGKHLFPEFATHGDVLREPGRASVYRCVCNRFE